jgi:hypothetical protein
MKLGHDSFLLVFATFNHALGISQLETADVPDNMGRMVRFESSERVEHERQHGLIRSPVSKTGHGY